MNIVSLRGAFFATKQSSHSRGDCFATARNDMLTVSQRELQSATGEELRPLFGRTLLPSMLDRAFKGEL